jgi:phosphopantetheine adenylyltransferase
VKEVAGLGGNVSGLIPDHVRARLEARAKKRT